MIYSKSKATNLKSTKFFSHQNQFYLTLIHHYYFFKSSQTWKLGSPWKLSIKIHQPIFNNKEYFSLWVANLSLLRDRDIFGGRQDELKKLTVFVFKAFDCVYHIRIVTLETYNVAEDILVQKCFHFWLICFFSLSNILTPYFFQICSW